MKLQVQLIVKLLKILDELLKSDITLILIAHNFDPSLRAMFDREIHLRKEGKEQ